MQELLTVLHAILGNAELTASRGVVSLATLSDQNRKPSLSCYESSNLIPNMTFDETTWEFPATSLKEKSSVLCLVKTDSNEIECIGGRITCEPLSLPDINDAYESFREEKVEIRLSFYFPFTSLAELNGQTLQLGEPVEEFPEELGSVYLFSAHNPVGWQSIAFAEAQGDRIEAIVDLYFDFDLEDRIGGVFRHKLPVVFEIERRWEM